MSSSRGDNPNRHAANGGEPADSGAAASDDTREFARGALPTGDETQVFPSVADSDRTQIFPAGTLGQAAAQDAPTEVMRPVPRVVQSNPFPLGEVLPTLPAEPASASATALVQTAQVQTGGGNHGGHGGYGGSAVAVAEEPPTPQRNPWKWVVLALLGLAVAIALVFGGIYVGKVMGGDKTATPVTSAASPPLGAVAESTPPAETPASDATVPSVPTAAATASDTATLTATPSDTASSSEPITPTDSTSASTQASQSESSSSESSSSSSASSAVSVPATSSFGDNVEFGDGVEVSVARPRGFTPSDNADYSGARQDGEALAIRVTITNSGDSAFDASEVPIEVTYNGAAATMVADPDNDTVSAPAGRVRAGRSVTYTLGVVSAPGNLVVKVSGGTATGDARAQSTQFE